MKKNKTTFLGGLILMVCCLAVTVASYAQGQEVFTTNVYSTGTSDAQTGPTSTWTVPAGVNTISIIAIGGGGGGGAIHSSFAGSGTTGAAGGGGGAYVKVDNYTVAPGDVLTIHVGSKGSGKNSQDSYNPGWGGDSWVKNGSTIIVLAKGASDVADKTYNVPGTGGQASACIAPSGSTVLSGGNGGTGSTGAWCGAGGGGAAGGGNGGNGSFSNRGAAGTNSIPHAGNGGRGSQSSTLISNSGENGHDYGGGGGGGATDIGWSNADGGDGAPGYVLITYSVSCDATAGSIALSTWECTSTDTAIVISSSADATSTGAGTYIWQYSTDNSTWSNISGANAPAYSAKNTGYYRRGYKVGTCDPVFTSSLYVTRPSDIDPGTIKDGDNKTEKAICAGTSVNITLTKTYSGNVQWQTSTDKVTWNNVSTNATYSIAGTPAATTYVRYLAQYSSSCNIPSNTIYTLTVNALPEVTSFTNPTNLCPGELSYEVNANITSSAAITDYTWTGVTSYTDETAQIVPSIYQCGHTYNYSLKVKDANGCESAVKNGSFTTTTPTMTFGTISVEATYNTTDCKYYVPTAAALTTAANDALTTSCGNEVTLSGFNPAAESEITATGTVTALATDKCGNTQNVSITVNVPTVTFNAPGPKTLALPYGSPTMNATTDMLGTPTYTPNDPSYTYESNVASLNPLDEGDHNVTWTLKNSCGEVIGTATQVVSVILDCPATATLDGYDYPVVRVGYDCWFKENVKATTSIEGAVAYNEEAANKDKFGLLYTWYAAMKAEPVSGSGSGSGGGPAPEMPAFFAFMASTSQGLCPDGWGIPTVTDFQNLFTYGGGNVAYLKHKDPTTWLPGKAGIDPSTGFNAPGAGYYNSALGRYEDLLDNVRYWTDSSVDPTSDKATCCEFNYYCNEPMFKVVSKLDKNSVRCIKKND